MFEKFKKSIIGDLEENTNEGEKKENIKALSKSEKNFLIGAVIIIFLIIFGIWLFYGTLHPCGILEKDLRNTISNIDPSSLTPLECIMIKIKGKSERHLEFPPLNL